MHMKIAHKLAQCVSLATSTMLAVSAFAAQTVTPYDAAAGGAVVATPTVSAGATLTFYGRYEISGVQTGNESGLGLKVKYDKTKFSNVVVDQVYTKCMIATPDQQESVPASSQVVFGWIDTSVRRTSSVPNGAVGWPATADPAAPGATDGCLNPGNIVTTQAGTTPPLALFRMQMTTLGSFTSGTTTVSLTSEGNFSYANATPGFTDKSITITGAAAPACNLDVDNSGTRTAFVDGILITRHLLNLQGATLTNAVNITGTRNTPAALTTFMSGINWDMTNAGSASAFRDGVILTRLMLGIPDASLLNGVTLPVGALQSAAAIRANVNTRCGTNF